MNRSVPFVCLSFLLALGACAPAAVVGAGATVGVMAAQERTMQDGANDTKIGLAISQKWFHHNVDMFSQLSATVNEGKVLITGIVADPDLRVDAVRLAWQVDGVREVINEIKVSDTFSFGNYARDKYISTVVSSKIMFDRDISSINFTIEVVDQVVYLMGIARTYDEMRRVEAHIRGTDYVRSLVNYARVHSPGVAPTQ